MLGLGDVAEQSSTTDTVASIGASLVFFIEAAALSSFFFLSRCPWSLCQLSSNLLYITGAYSVDNFKRLYFKNILVWCFSHVQVLQCKTAVFILFVIVLMNEETQILFPHRQCGLCSVHETFD